MKKKWDKLIWNGNDGDMMGLEICLEKVKGVFSIQCIIRYNPTGDCELYIYIWEKFKLVENWFFKMQFAFCFHMNDKIFFKMRFLC